VEYLCLIYSDEKQWAALSDADRQAMYQEYGAFTEGIKKSGHFKGGNALEKSDTGTIVRVRDGKTSTTDGPFAETKEQLGGYYLVEARDLNEAIAIAARIPGARYGAIEVRPIPVMTGAARPA